MSLISLVDSSSFLLSEIVNFIEDRPIVIVGSSKDLSGIEIQYPVVVRLNSSRRWGNCDIWFNNYCNGLDEHFKSSGLGNEKFIIRGNGDREGSNMVRNYPTEWYEKTLFWNRSPTTVDEATEKLIEEVECVLVFLQKKIVGFVL